MTARYSLTLDDLLAFHRYLQGRNPATRPAGAFTKVVWTLFLLLMGLLVLGGGIKTDFTNPGTVLAWVAVLALGLLALCILFPGPLQRLQLRKSYKSAKKQGLLDDIETTLSAEQLSQSTDVAATMLKWSAVLGIDRTDEHIVVMLTENSGYVIPRRAFADEREFLDFFDTAGHYLTAYGRGSDDQQ